MFKDWLCFGTNIKVKMCTFIGRVRGRFGAGFLFWNKACLDLCLVVFFISYFFLRSVFSWIFLFVVTKENWSSKSLIWTSETVLFKIGLVGGMSNLLRVSRRAILVWFSDLHVTEWDSDDCRGHSLCPALAGWFFVFFGLSMPLDNGIPFWSRFYRCRNIVVYALKFEITVKPFGQMFVGDKKGKINGTKC